MKRSQSIALIAVIALASVATAQEYQVARTPDGPFAMKILGVAFNEGSTLKRESILLNVSSCPVQLTSSALKFDYGDHGFRYKTHTTIQVQQGIAAIEIRHALYDLFGNHMKNLSNVDGRDFAPGPAVLDGTWNIIQENDLSEHLTTVTYVASIRFTDGRIWRFQAPALISALRGLNLEQKLEDDDRAPRP